MSKVVKGTVGVAVIVALAYAGSSWYMGQKVEDAVHTYVPTVNTYIQDQLKLNATDKSINIEVLSYDRGIFSSSVRYVIKAKGMSQPLEFFFTDSIVHGPFPWVALTKGKLTPLLAASHLRLDKQGAEPAFAMTNGETPVQAENYVHFSGNVDSDITVAAFNFQDDEASIESKPVLAKVNYSPKKSHLEISGHSKGLEIVEQESDAEVIFKEWTFGGQIDGLDVSKGDQKSTGFFNMSQIDVLIAQSAVIVKDFNVTSSSELKGDLADAHASYQIASILVNDKDIGALDLDMEATNLNMAAINGIIELSETTTDANEPEVQALLTEFFKANPEIALNNLSWKNKGGESYLKAKMQFAPTVLSEPTDPFAIDLSQYFKVLDLDMSVSRKVLSAALENASMIGALVDMGFDQAATQYQQYGLTQYDGTTAKTKLTFNSDKNELMLNGAAITAEELEAKLQSLR